MKHRAYFTPSTAATIAYFTALMLLGLTTAVTGPTLPALASHTGSRIDQISLIFVAGSLGYLSGSWIGGRAYDRLPGHRIISLAILVIAISVAFIPVVSVLWILAVVIFISGFSQGVVDVGGNTLLMWVQGDKVGPYMNGLHFFFGLGALISPILVAFIVQGTGEINWVYWLFSLIGIPLAAWIWFIPSPSPNENTQKESSAPVYFTIFILIIIFYFLYVGAELGYGNWLYTYTTTLKLGTPVTAAYLTSVFWGFFTLGRLLGIPISAKVGPNRILFVDLIGCLMSIGLIIVGSESVEILWIGTIAFGLFAASIFPTMMTLAEKKLHMTGSVTSWFLVGSGLGGMVLPWVIGQAFTSIGPQVVMKFIFLDLLANLIVYIAIIGRIYFLDKSRNPIANLEEIV